MTNRDVSLNHLFKTEVPELSKGNEVTIRPHGHSMKPIVCHKDDVVLAPVNDDTLAVGDVVLVRVRGHVYLHKVIALERQRALIGNNHGGING